MTAEQARTKAGRALQRGEAIEQEAARPLPEPQPDERVSVRIKVYGGGRSLLAPGTDWRVERTTEHVAPSGLIGEVMPEWTLIDLQPLGALPDRPEPSLNVDLVEQAFKNIGLWLDYPRWTTVRREKAEKFAAEYDRLSQPPDPATAEEA